LKLPLKVAGITPGGYLDGGNDKYACFGHGVKDGLKFP